MSPAKAAPPGPRQYRQLGLVFGVALGLLGLWWWWRGRGYYPYALAAAGVFAALGLLVPAALKPLYRVWMALGHVLGLVMSQVVLALLFYLVVTPIGLTARLFGKDFLKLKIEPARPSYWVPKPAPPEDIHRYEKQY